MLKYSGFTVFNKRTHFYPVNTKVGEIYWSSFMVYTLYACYTTCNEGCKLNRIGTLGFRRNHWHFNLFFQWNSTSVELIELKQNSEH